jgi:phosphoribosylanthranilate isomerase
MFRIKICGVTNPDDALAALEAGADAIGLNFYEKSQRRVDIQAARAITDAIYEAAGVRFRGLVYPVGVFVNHSASDVKRIFDAARLVAAQLHGDEPPEFLAALDGIPAIRVRRLDERGGSALSEDLNACPEAVEAMLVDAATPGKYGGTGETVAWATLADHERWLGMTPLILAGGLTPDNVAEAIRIVHPHGVDVASGVESSPGKKDHAKIRDFVAAAREAFAQL